MNDKERQLSPSLDGAQGSNRTPEDEVNLIELLEVLLNRKTLIIFITSVFIISAVLYSLWVTPLYKAAIEVRKTNEIHIIDLIKGVDKVSRPEVSKEFFFSEFINRMRSYEHFQKVFNSGNFLEKFNVSISEPKNSDQFLSELFSSIIIFKRLEHNVPSHFSVFTIKGHEPKVVSDFLNALYEAAIRDIQTEMAEKLEAAEKIITAEAQSGKQYLIKFLTKELELAKKMNIKNTNLQYAGPAVQPIWFLYGVSALEAEVKALKASADNPSWEEAMMIHRKLEAFAWRQTTRGNLTSMGSTLNLKLLRSINDPLVLTKVVSVKASTPPTDPIKPNKAKVIFIGALLGLFLGIVTAFLNNSIENFRKMNKETGL